MLDVEARRYRPGMETFVAAELEPLGASYTFVVWAWSETGTREGYVSATGSRVKYTRIHRWLNPREVLEGRMLHTAREGYYEGPFKKILSSLLLAEKVGAVPRIVRESDWIFVKVLEKLRRKSGGKWVQWARQTSSATSRCGGEHSRGRNGIHGAGIIVPVQPLMIGRGKARRTRMGWVNWFLREKRASEACRSKMWDCGHNTGWISWSLSGEHEGGTY